MNVYDEMENQQGFHGANYNQSGSLTSTASDITVAKKGWYKLSADQDFYWRGPTSGVSAATNASRHEWRFNEPLVYVPEDGYHLSIIREAIDGSWFLNCVKEK